MHTPFFSMVQTDRKNDTCSGTQRKSRREREEQEEVGQTESNVNNWRIRTKVYGSSLTCF